jgi:hypothetical protein
MAVRRSTGCNLSQPKSAAAVMCTSDHAFSIEHEHWQLLMALHAETALFKENR